MDHRQERKKLFETNFADDDNCERSFKLILNKSIVYLLNNASEFNKLKLYRGNCEPDIQF